MLALNHTLVGAAIGSQINNLPVVVGLGVASHFVLDFLPHVDPGTKFKGKKLRSVIKYFLAGVDVFISLLILILVLMLRPQLNRTTIITGAVTALLMDIIFNVPFWMSWFRSAWPFSKIHQFHELTHKPLKKYQYSLGIPLQIIIVIISLWLLLR
jgi:hypothetical protein